MDQELGRAGQLQARKCNTQTSTNPNTTPTRSPPCHTTHTRSPQNTPPDWCRDSPRRRRSDDSPASDSRRRRSCQRLVSVVVRLAVRDRVHIRPRKPMPARPAPRRLLPLRLRRQPIAVRIPVHPVWSARSPPGLIHGRQPRLRVIAGVSPSFSLRALHHFTQSYQLTVCTGWLVALPEPALSKAVAVAAIPRLHLVPQRLRHLIPVHVKRAHITVCSGSSSEYPSPGSMQLPIVKLPAGMSTMPEGGLGS